MTYPTFLLIPTTEALDLTLTANCPDCGSPLPARSDGLPCPACGGQHRHYNKTITARVGVGALIDRTREHVERHPVLYPVTFALLAGGIFFGFAGPVGGLAGAACSLVGFWLGPKAARTIRETMRGR